MHSDGLMELSGSCHTPEKESSTRKGTAIEQKKSQPRAFCCRDFLKTLYMHKLVALIASKLGPSRNESGSPVWLRSDQLLPVAVHCLLIFLS